MTNKRMDNCVEVMARSGLPLRRDRGVPDTGRRVESRYLPSMVQNSVRCALRGEATAASRSSRGAHVLRKSSVLLFVLLSIFGPFAFGDGHGDPLPGAMVMLERLQSEGGAESPSRIRNGAMIWRPVPLVRTALIDKGFEIAIQCQAAFTSRFGGTCINHVSSIDGELRWVGFFGPQFHPFGQYLHGVLVGVYPGAGWAGGESESRWLFAASAEVGYQWVGSGGLTLGLTTGGSLYADEGLSVQWDINLQVGVAFPDPIFKPR